MLSESLLGILCLPRRSIAIPQKPHSGDAISSVQASHPPSSTPKL